MLLACFVNFIQPWSFWRGRHPRKMEAYGVGKILVRLFISSHPWSLWRGRHPRKLEAYGVGKILVRLFISSHPWSLWRGVGSTLTSGTLFFGTIPLENYPSEHIWPLTSSLIRPYTQLDPRSTVNAHKHAGKTHVNPLVIGVSQ